MASVATLEKLSRASDPKQALINEVGDLSKIELMSNKVLVAIYIAPEKTKGGIIRATQSLKEDIFQGTVGLVLKKAKLAFKDDEATKTYFHDQDVKVGDWVVFRCKAPWVKVTIRTVRTSSGPYSSWNSSRPSKSGTIR